MNLDVRRPQWAPRRLGRGGTRPRRFTFILASLALLISSLGNLMPLPAISPVQTASANHTNIKLPVKGGETWVVTQGYNTNPANGGSHYSCNPTTLRDQPSGTVSCSAYWQYKYSLDIAVSNGETTGRNVLSPVNGTIRWIDQSYGGMSIDLGDGYAYAFFHVELASSLAAGQTITQGQFLGTVAAPGNRGNGGFAHIHVTLWRTTDGGNWSRIPEPFTGDHAIDGVSLPAQADSSVNQYRGTSITSTNSSTTNPSATVPDVPQLTAPANGTTYATAPQAVTLAWTAETGATGYQVVINDGAITSPWVSTTSWTTSALPSGQYAWQVRSRNSSGQSALSAKLVFWVDPTSGGGTPTPGTTPGPLATSVQTTSGVPGFSTYALGSGMTAGETVEVFWDSATGTKLATTTANSAGNWVAAVQIPEAPGGSHNLVAKGKTSNKSANAAFTVKQQLQRSPYQAPPGTTISVTVRGFGASEVVNFVFYHTTSSTSTLASITTNSAGTASVTFPMPEATVGDHDYKVTGATSGLSAWGALNIQPSVTLSATQGASGTSVTATAKGFAASSSTRFAWNQTSGSNGTTLCTVTTTSKGTASCAFTVPSASAGAYPVVATSSDGSTGSANFGVAGAASITLTPANGTVGAPVQISIGGFQANETVRLTIDGASTTWQSATIGSTGAASLPSTIPFLTQGSHTIQAKGATSGKTSSATLTVQPSMSVSPSGGAPGSSATAYVRGMKANASVSVRFNATSSSTGSSVCSGTTSGDGSFTCNFTVPNLNRASYPVFAASGSNNATTTYAITATGTVGGGVVIGPGTYQITATREGLVGQQTSNGHIITDNDHFVSLPACTPANCDWLAPGSVDPKLGYVANCSASTTCFVRVTNPANGECRVEPVWDTGPWFTNDNWWDAAERRNLNNLSSTVNILPQGYTGADAARDGLNVGYGISNGIGVSNKGYQTGNRASIDIADGTWADLGFDYGAGPVTVVVSMLWQTGEDVSAARAACNGATPNEPAVIGINPNYGASGASIAVTGSGFSAGESVTIHWDTTSSTPLKTVTANSSGGFSTTIAVPSTTTGNHLVAAKGATSGEKASRTYTVLSTPKITLSPLTGPSGTTITVTGQGYKPSEQVQVYWDSTGSTGTLLKTVTATSLGTFSTTVTVPSATAGDHRFIGKGVISGNKPSRTFTLTAPVAPSINITVTSGPVGTSVPVTGQGYAPGETVDIRWNRSTGTVLRTINANSSGAFSTTITIPNAEAGKYYIVGVGRTSGAKPSRSFTVVEVSPVTPAISISPLSGRTATTVAVSGVGYSPNETVQVYFNSTGSTGTLLGTTTATASGTFSTNVTIPHTTGGGHRIIGKGVTSGAKPSRTFTVTASVSLSATSAAPGTVVRFTLRGFQAGEAIELTWDTIDGRPLGTVTASSTGSAAGSFTIPSTISGVHRVMARGAVLASSAANANITVTGGSNGTPAATSVPATGNTGATVTINASGFWAQEQIQVFWDGGTSASGTATTTFEGDGTVRVRVPTVPGGSHTWTVKGVSSGLTATTTFTIEPRLALTPSSGGVGDRIVADVKGWSPGVTATIYFNRAGNTGGTAVCSATGRASGTASCSFIIPTGFSVGTVVPITATGTFGTVRASLTITATTASTASEATPTPSATASPTAGASATPVASETPAVTETATPEPGETATPEPTTEPTEIPTEEPTVEPTPAPTEVPTEVPTEEPTPVPTEIPTEVPTEEPTPEPTLAPEPRAVTIYAATDATTYGARPDELAPGDQIGVLQTGGADGAIAYVTFSIEGIGAGTVTDAYLVLTGGGDGAAGSAIYTVPGLWVDEGAATYNNLPSQGLAPAVDAAGNVVYLPYIGWGEEAWLNVAGTIYGDGVITFVITGTPEAIANLTSRESGVTPRLEITVQD